MKNFYNFKYLNLKFKEYIFIFLTATIISIFSTTKSFTQENVFIVDNIKVEGIIDLNFNRDKYIIKAFKNSFKILVSKILLSKDSNKIIDLEFNKIKSLIKNFQVIEESYKSEKYKGTFKIVYNDKKVQKLLREKNISFSQPKQISAVFFPILVVNDTIQDFDKNYFYTKWEEIKVKNESINFILPIDDLDDFSKILKMKDKIDEREVNNIVNKYNVSNYVFVLMDYNNTDLSMHVKTNLDNNKINKNFSYTINNINDESKLNLISQELKMKITDIWKEANLVNLLMPLSIKIKFKYLNLSDLDKLKDEFYKINIIDSFDMEEFNINYSFFKIYYYGNPKKLRNELLRSGYELNNDQGYWELYLND